MTESRAGGKPYMTDFFFSFYFFLGPYLWHMEGVKSELQLLAYTTATATPDP